MTLHIFGDSWGTPLGIKDADHWLARYSANDYVNHSECNLCLSHIRHYFFSKISNIDPSAGDTVFFIIPPDIRMFMWSRGNLTTISLSNSVGMKDYRKMFRGVSLAGILEYFNQVIGSEILLLQNTCRSLGLSYTMWHNYGVIDFDSHPYYNLIDTTRFVSRRSMMTELLGVEHSLNFLEDGPNLNMIDNSPYFLPNDCHPSLLGHDRLLEIYTNWANR